jgi:hypothetical protein
MDVFPALSAFNSPNVEHIESGVHTDGVVFTVIRRYKKQGELHQFTLFVTLTRTGRERRGVARRERTATEL